MDYLQKPMYEITPSGEYLHVVYVKGNISCTKREMLPSRGVEARRILGRSALEEAGETGWDNHGLRN